MSRKYLKMRKKKKKNEDRCEKIGLVVHRLIFRTRKKKEQKVWLGKKTENCTPLDRLPYPVIHADASSQAFLLPERLFPFLALLHLGLELLRLQQGKQRNTRIVRVLIIVYQAVIFRTQTEIKSICSPATSGKLTPIENRESKLFSSVY